MQEIASMAKVELHRHLEMSFDWNSLYKMAQEDGEKQDFAAFKKNLILDSPSQNLAEVLHKFLDPSRILNTPERISQIIKETCDEAINHGIKLLELRFAPTFLADLNDMEMESILKGIIDGLPKDSSNISVGLIAIFQRTKPIKDLEKVWEFIEANKETFIGVDLADDEDNYDSHLFSGLFKKVRDLGLPVTIHSGEVNSQASIKNIGDSIELLGAQRIGHGIQAIKDQATINLLKRENIHLEVCPTSNWITQGVDELKNHPIRKLYDAGISLSINTDDPAVFDTDILKEYQICQKYFGFTTDEFKHMNQLAFAASFLPESEKNCFSKSFD